MATNPIHLPLRRPALRGVAVGRCGAFVQAIDDQTAARPCLQSLVEELCDGRTGRDLILCCRPSLVGECKYFWQRCELGDLRSHNDVGIIATLVIGRKEEVGDGFVRDGRKVFDDARGQNGLAKPRSSVDLQYIRRA